VYQTGFRNPTTQAQHIDLNVISAQLIGGLPQYAEKYQINYNTYTLASVTEYTNRVIAAGTTTAIVDPANIAVLQRFETFRPVRPEQIASIEVGYKGLLMNQKLMVDMSFYHNEYTNFEYQTRVRRASGDVSANAINASSLLSGSNLNTFQVYTNAKGSVKSMGASFGLNYNLPKNYTISSNYNWNTLDKGVEDNNGIYQFNTPEHKVNFTFANRKVTDRLGFAATWRWQQEFLWEGSFAVGTVPSFSTLDAQVSYKVPSMKSVFKIGGSNLLNERYIMNYGSPTLGAIYYVSITFDQFLNK
jgi:outer membrane receptor for ferric coprogen and ferric-rhodotorulic acid